MRQWIPDTLYDDIDDIDDIINYNNLIILATCKEHIRYKNVTIRSKDKPWMCNEVRFFLRKTDRCFKGFKRTLSTQDKFNFYLARREANRAIRNAKKRFETKVVDSLSDPNLNIRNFWKLSKRILDDLCWKITSWCLMMPVKLKYLTIILFPSITLNPCQDCPTFSF